MAAPSKPPAVAIDTIFALSSGPPPAAIAVVRLSGPDAGTTLRALSGALPEPRRASLRALRDADGDLLDHALVLWFPGPNTATGEDLAELHLHGGRAVVDAVTRTLAARGLRLAEPGEFTRRALLNGRLDLGAVEGLADLLAAETDYQRREALRRADGAIGRMLAGWTRKLLDIAATLEASIDYDGEEEVSALGAAPRIGTLITEIDSALAVAPAEMIREGPRVVIVGSPNTGKSSLFNALVGRDAAIVSDVPGTTRDLIERPVSIGGMPFVLIDTAGIRETDEAMERIGVARARDARAKADIVIDLEADASSESTIAVSTKIDLYRARAGTIGISVVTGVGLDLLLDALATAGARLLPGPSDVALDRHYRERLRRVRTELDDARKLDDPVLVAEHVRHARELLDALAGGAGLDDMLDALFGRFCLGK